MTERIIPVLDARAALRVPTGADVAADGRVADQLQRPLRDLRISVTDRCNFRCMYCMPRRCSTGTTASCRMPTC
jgi:cyclic pyranopterin phosphate synthase